MDYESFYPKQQLWKIVENRVDFELWTLNFGLYNFIRNKTTQSRKVSKRRGPISKNKKLPTQVRYQNRTKPHHAMDELLTATLSPKIATNFDKEQIRK